MKVVPVIMAGGAGARLWPMSRDEKPKQFLNLSGKGSLLEETVLRLRPLNPEIVVIATAKKYEALSQKELAKSGIPGVVLAEPRSRNTAAAILYAALYISKKYGDGIMTVLPADHYIGNPAEYQKIIGIAVDEASHNSLVTIGIRPSYPETGYGYIKATAGAGAVRDVDHFVEKPDAATAQKYVDAGDYFWNSGIFVWKASVILEAFKAYLPDMLSIFNKLAELVPDDIASNDGAVWTMKEEIFNAIESVSVDYGIMEKAENVKVIPAEFGWADLGSWKSIDDILVPDKNGNRAPQPERTIFIDAEDCSVFSEDSRISVVGLSNVVVVQAGNEILVIDKEASQDVRRVVDVVRVKNN